MPFQPGQSGNKGGRKDKPFRDALMLAINEADGDRTKLRSVAEALVNKAIEGDVPALKEVADRIDGKVPQGVGGDDELDPIQIYQRIERVIIGQDIKDTDGESIRTVIATKPL